MCAAVTHPHEASMLVQTEQCCHLSLPTLAWDCRHSSSFAASRDGEGWEANSIEIRKQTDLWASVSSCAHFGENLRKWNSTLQTYIFTLGLLSIIQWAQAEPIFTPPLRLALTVPVHAPDSHWLWSQFYQTLPLNRCAVCLPSPQPLLLLEPGAYGGIQEHKDNFKWDSGIQDVQRLIPLQPVMAVGQTHLYLLDPEISLQICSNAWLFQYLISHYVSHTLTELNSLAELQDRILSACLWYHSFPSPSPLLWHKWQTRWQTSSNPFLVQACHFGLVIR